MRLCPKGALAAAVTLLSLGQAVCAHSQTVRKQAEKWQIDGMVAALQDPVPETRVFALLTMTAGSIAHNQLPPSAVGLEPSLQWDGVPESLIVPFLNDPTPFVRSLAIAALGVTHAGDQEALVAARLEDKKEPVEVREAAV